MLCAVHGAVMDLAYAYILYHRQQNAYLLSIADFTIVYRKYSTFWCDEFMDICEEKKRGVPKRDVMLCTENQIDTI